MNRSDCLDDSTFALPLRLGEGLPLPRPPGSLKFHEKPWQDPPWPTTPAGRLRLAIYAGGDTDFQLNDALVPGHNRYFGAYCLHCR